MDSPDPLTCSFEGAVIGAALGQVRFTPDPRPPRINAALVTALEIGAPGELTETWSVPGPVTTGQHDGLFYAHNHEFLFGTAYVPPTGRYSGPVRSAYDLALTTSRDLGYPRVARMWNHIGRINDLNADGLENYQDFCVGRAQAFADHGIAGDRLPAGTGVGMRSPGIAFYFLACRTAKPVGVENPLMIPAYRYPRRYGPRSPSFSRATALSYQDTKLLFLSGTSAVLGHRSMHRGDVKLQSGLALENLTHLLKSAGHALPDLLAAKVYVRHHEDLDTVRQLCAAALPRHTALQLIEADICRRELLVEIEGVAVSTS